MVKAVFTRNKEISKNFTTPKDGFIQKKRNNKFKQTPSGRIALINGSKALNDKNMKQQNLQKQTGNSPKKSSEKTKDQNRKGYQSNDKRKELTKKKITMVEEKDDSDSEIDEDINEGVVLEDQSMVDESDNCENEEESDDESEEEKNVPNILGNSLADESDDDDDDYEEEEEEGAKNVQLKKGVKMFKGLKQADSSSDSAKNSLDNSALEETSTDDNDDDLEEEEEEEEDGEDDDDETNDDNDDEELEEEDCGSNENGDQDEDDGVDEDEEDEDEDEDEADESALGLKALLDNTIADDDEDDEDFVESGENDEDDDISDEEDEEEEEDGNNTVDSSQQNTSIRDKADTYPEKMEIDKRTVFVGNLPIGVKREQLKKLFKKFGTIETIRLRGTVSKSVNIPKKVAAITKDVHPNLKSVYAYIFYASEKCAKAAVAMNGTVFEGNYLRVDIAEKPEDRYDPKKSIFLGNLNFKLDNNTLRKHFAQCGEIESVRMVKDNKTGAGKGIGFVNFKSEDAVALALELDGTMIMNREVRVKRNVDANKKKEERGKRSHSAESGQSVAHKKSKNNDAVPVPVRNKQNAVKRISDKEQQFGKKETSPRQGKTFQGQKADASKKKKKNTLERKKKILAEKLTAKSKKPSN